MKNQEGIQLVELQQRFDEVITCNYLQSLSDLDILPIENDVDKKICKVTWFKISKIVLDKDTFFCDKLSMLYTALHKTAKNVVLVIDKHSDSLNIYLGARDFGNGNERYSASTLESGLKGFLPGIQYAKDANNILEKVDNEKSIVSCVSALASLRDDKKTNFVQGLEKLINSTIDIPEYKAIFIADSITNDESNSIINALRDLSSQLSPLEECQLTLSNSQTEGITESLTNTITESISKNIGKTITNSEGYSDGITDTTSSSTNNGINNCNNIIKTLWSKVAGGEVGTNTSTTTQDAKATTHQDQHQKAIGLQQNVGENEGHSIGTNSGISESLTKGESKQISYKNRFVKSYNDILDNQIKRMENGIPYGLWSVATYFVAPKLTSSYKLANIYRGCIIGEDSNQCTCAINVWKDKETSSKLTSYLKQSLQPRFRLTNELNVSAGAIITSKEMAVQMPLPQSSIPGLLVREEQSFGRCVITPKIMDNNNSIRIGSVLHLGRIYEKSEVNLFIENLSKHTFIAGTTGSGKSNTLYLILQQLLENGRHFLVIEPAKGEYKNVFGSGTIQKQYDIHVYGSNPKSCELLAINPFKFDKQIDIYEHIDSLLEIFSACWPMYAAMPQVLKHSIIEAYKQCGWDLATSRNPQQKFPTVLDVVQCIKTYIQSSEFSGETKGDYIGALETRMISLTEGVEGRIFTNSNDTSEELLFNHNVIIDLSGVKSTEAKSLIMGMLILKLNEYRVSESLGMNQSLRHVTVLEEAHNLLKRTSTIQNAETSNISGMAVEKIANSMAEMRTYGEGFIIADQSPALLDLSVIRHTNTKIIMTLPDKEDRDEAGKSIGLNDNQILEISKLKTGEAIVYQNGWEEPVKCMIDLFSIPNDDSSLDDTNTNCSPIKRILVCLYNAYTSSNNEHIDKFLQDIIISNIQPPKKINIFKLLQNKKTLSPDLCAIIFALYVGYDTYCNLFGICDFNEKYYRIRESVGIHTYVIGHKYIDTFMNMYVKGCSMLLQQPNEYDKWINNLMER